ncbi:hypothetical protein [Streptomyces sp. NPDC088789]
MAGQQGQRFSQIGNAVLSRLAARPLALHLDRDLTHDDVTLAA